MTEQSGDIDPEARPRLARRARSHALRTVLSIVLIPVILAALAPVLFLGQDITAPTWIKDRIEVQAERMLEGGSLTFGAITVQVARDLHPQVRLTDAVLRDAAGAVLAEVPQIAVQISPRGLLLRREVLVQSVVLSGAQIALARAPDGTVAVAFDRRAPDQSRPAGRAAGLAEMLDGIDAAMTRPALEALRSVRIEALDLIFEDARAGRRWTVSDGRAALVSTAQGLHLTSDLAVTGEDGVPTRLTLAFYKVRGAAAASIDLQLRDVAAGDIATQSPALAWLGLLDARLTATMQAEVVDGVPGPVAVTLDIGEGTLSPSAGTPPVAFSSAGMALVYDPEEARVVFDKLRIASDWVTVAATGQAYLRDMTNGRPETILGQFALSNMVLAPGDLYPEPLALGGADAAFRLRLDPFAIDIGAFGVTDAGEAPARLDATGHIGAGSDGWSVALDARVARITLDRLLALWPERVKPGTRRWFAQNIASGALENVAAGLRIVPGQAKPDWALSMDYAAEGVRVMRTLPVVNGTTGSVALQDQSVTVTVATGHMAAPQGGNVRVGGSVFRIPDTTIFQPPATVSLRTSGTITAALSLLDQPPFEFLTKANREVTLAQGHAAASGDIGFRMRRPEPGDAVSIDMAATLTDVTSDRLIPGRTLAAPELTVTATSDALTIGGAMRLGQVPADVTWTTALGPGADGTSRIDGTVELSERFIDEFGIGLPPGLLSGSGTGTLRLDLARDAAPAFALSSDLQGLRLAFAPLNWSKAPGTAGQFDIAGTLGPVPRVDALSIDAAGLRAQGDVRLTAAGLDRARFTSVRLGTWLNTAVTLTGRGPGQPVGIDVATGTLDLQGATFGGNDSGDGGGPITVSLDRLQVTPGIALRNFRGSFDAAGGFEGQFTGFLNGDAPISGAVAPSTDGTAIRVESPTAGQALAAAGLLQTASGGQMSLVLVPRPGTGSYDAQARITDLSVTEAPTVAKLVDALSVVGLLQQLDGQGIYFNTVDALFRIDPGRITVTRASAEGPGLGISIDGFYDTVSRALDFQGVMSPLYLINGVGAALTRPGEGLIGVSFTLQGTASDPQVGINPLSVLAPGGLRDLFRRPPPLAGQ